MEEIIEIIIRLLNNFFQNRAINPVPSKTTAQKKSVARAAVAVRAEPPSRATVTQNMPTARRGVRRPPALQSVAVARPILTNLPAAAAAPAVMAPARPIQAKSNAATAHVTTAPGAAAIRKWLTPATLKSQFILTEILQPPLALREDRRLIP